MSDDEHDRAPSDDEGDEGDRDRTRAEADGGEREPAPKKKKKKRKKKRAPEPEAQLAVSVGRDSASAGRSIEPQDDDARPAFARSYPRDATLDALVEAFQRGDYGRVRSEAPALARATEDDSVRRAARDLRARIDPDPLSVYLMAGALALLAALAGYYWTHPHVP